MKLLTKSIAFFLIFLIGISFSYSQEDVLRPKGKPGGYDYTFERAPFIIGFEGGVNFNMYSQTLNWDDNYYSSRGFDNGHPTEFDDLNSATGLSPHFGFLVDVPLGKTFAIQARFSYDMKNYGTTSSGWDYANWGQNEYSIEDIEMDVDVTSAYFTISPLLRINVNENLFFTVGPTIHFLMGDIETTWKPTVVNQGATLDQFQFWALRPDAQGVYSMEYTEVSNTDNELAFSPRYGIEAGIGYKIPINKGIYLVPQGRFQYMFTKNLDDTGWYDVETLEIFQTTTDKMLHSLQFALAIWFEL